MQASLLIQNLSIFVHLGCEDWELSQKQEIYVTLCLRFPTPPKGCETDRIEDTLCYKKLCDCIEAQATAKPYHLIEHLGAQVLEALKTLLPSPISAELSVHKLHPPIPKLKGGSVFTLHCQI
jgi:dihydroneopterin aldolase